MADNIIIDDVTVERGGTFDLPIKYSFTSNTDKVGFTFALSLPSGISLVLDDGDVLEGITYTKDASLSRFSINYSEGIFHNFQGLPNTEKATIKNTQGTLLTLHLIADNNLAPGSQHVVNVCNCLFQQRVDGSVSDIKLDDFSFNVTIEGSSDGRVVLSETSTTAPETATGVNVRVQRTITADKWSTICLPFSMSAEQMTTAFGSEVELGHFLGYEVTEEAGENIAIVNFEKANAIEANHPYIIKVNADVTEFTVDGVNINPVNAPCVNGDPSGTFKGTYVADFDFYNASESQNPLFLNGGKFYYATEKTKHMKAFRAYFDLVGSSSTRAMISFGSNGTTGIENADFLQVKTGRVYSISGQYLGERENMERLPKGIYIIDGKKEVVK